MPILSVKEAAEIKIPTPVSQEYFIYDKKVVAASTSGSEAEHIATEKVGNQEFVILFAEKGIRVY
jgi:hypothetical protein